MCVTYNKAIFYDFLLTISGSGCIPVVILVEDLNLWFHRDLLSLIVKWTFQELLTTFPLFAHKWRSKHTHILQYFWNRGSTFFHSKNIWKCHYMHHTIILHEESMSLCNITPHATFSIQYSLRSYNMIMDEVSITEKFVGIMMKPTSQAYKDESFISQNLKKNEIKRKNTLFFHPDVSSPACNHTTCK
jgi:hypothetical protein